MVHQMCYTVSMRKILKKINQNSNNAEIFSVDYNASKKSFPLLLTIVPAGFPSPADDYVEHKLDLNEHLIQHPTATFFVRVEGDSMIDANIYSGDILIVDRALEVHHNSIVVAHMYGEFTVKRVEKKNNQLYLAPANKNYAPLLITSEMDIEIWGVVSYIIHKAS